MYVREVWADYFESCAISNGIGTGYVIELRVGADRSRGAIITSFDFVPPWPDHEIDWESDLENVLPKDKRHIYEELIETRFSAVLKERALIYRSQPVEGLLYGSAMALIPESSPRNRPAMAQITLADDSGTRVVSTIALTIFNLAPQKSELRAGPRRGRLRGFTCADVAIKAQISAFLLALSEVGEKITEWRRSQSRANYSLPKFPANREKYREYCENSRRQPE